VIVTVEVEHLEELLTVLFGEDGIFCDNITCKDGFFVFLGVLLATVQHIQN